MELDEIVKNNDHVELLKKINIGNSFVFQIRKNHEKETYWCVPPKTDNLHIQDVKAVDGQLKFLAFRKTIEELWNAGNN